MAYVDGFIAAVPSDRRDAYRAHAEIAASVLRENGATRVVECWGDDVPEGEVTSFPLAVRLRDGETAVFSWVEWPTKAVRDVGMAAMFSDPRMQPDANPMPFDGKRVVYGGFAVLLDR